VWGIYIAEIAVAKRAQDKTKPRNFKMPRRDK
jgi:hypothetical protein